MEFRRFRCVARYAGISRYISTHEAAGKLPRFACSRIKKT